MSKIGQQFQSGIVQDLGRLLAKKPVALKLIGNAVNLGIARTIRAQSPDTLIILRAAMDNWSLDAGVTDFCNRSMSTAAPFLAEGLCDFLEPPNEPVVQNDVDARRLNDQMVQCASIYKNSGFTPIAYSFSVGNPDYPLWQYLNDGILACDGWLGLHEYGAPNMQRDAENLSLRHRKARTFMSSAVQGILKIGVTECFIDLGIGRPPDGEPTSGGYRALRNPTDDDLWWIRNLTTQLDWWDAELAKDAYVRFTTGYGYAMEEPWVGLGFDVANVDTDRAFYIAWQKSGDTPPVSRSVSASPSPSTSRSPSVSASHAPEDDMQVYQPYAFPQRLAAVAWTGEEGIPTPNEPFYRIQPSAGLLTGVSAFAQLVVTNVHGLPLAGVKVINDFGDGHGEVQQTDAGGLVQFNFGTSSAFTPPAPPPLTFFVADDSAYRDDDRFIHYHYRLSDIVHGGDTNGNHTEGSFVLVQQVVMPDAVSRDDAIRLRAYPAKALTIPVYCAACALQSQGRKRNLGAVLSDEFYVGFGAVYVAQGFALGILATIVGHYADSDFFMEAW